MNHRRRWLPLVCLLAVVQALPMVAQTAGATDNGLIPREVLFGNPERTHPRISPEGTRLAYLAPDSKGLLNVWVRTIGKTDDEVVTSDKKRGIRFFQWQFDSQHVLYIQDRDGDENWHLYQTELKTKMTRDLTPFEGIQAQPVEYLQEFPDTTLVAMNIRDRRFHDVYRIDLKTGAVEMEAENPGDVTSWTADNTLQVRAAQATTPDGGTIIRVRDNNNSPWRELLKWGPDETLGEVFAFSPENKSVWIGTSVGANATQLLEADAASGKTKAVAGDPLYDVSEVMINNKTHVLEAVSFIRSKPEWAVLDKSVAADYEVLRKVREGVVTVVSRDRDDKNWVVRYVSDRAPIYFYAYDRAAKKAKLLFSSQPKLEGYKLAAMEPISFKARYGMEIYGYLTVPVGIEPKNLPMVMFVHGGPWGRDVWA